MKKVVIFGCGRYGQRIIEKLRYDKNVEIVAIIDNYAKETAQTGGYPLFRPEKVSEIEYDYILLALDAVDEAMEQLIALGVDYYKINTSFIIQNGIGARDIFLKNFAEDHRQVAGAVAEAGVFKGAFSEKINRAFPDRKLYLFDTFEGFDERDVELEIVTAENPIENASYFSQTSEQLVLNRLEYPQNAVICKGHIPETLEGIDDEFCFINLDMDLYKPTLDALEFFWDKVVDGGGILIHDFYNDYSFPNLKKGVMEFADIRGINYFPIGDGLSVFLPKTRCQSTNEKGGDK